MAFPPSWLFPSLEFPLEANFRRAGRVHSTATPHLGKADGRHLRGDLRLGPCTHIGGVRDRVRMTLGLLALSALAGSFVTSWFMPMNPFLLHPQSWRATGMFAWLFVAVAAFDLVRHLAEAARPPVSRAARCGTTTVAVPGNGGRHHGSDAAVVAHRDRRKARSWPGCGLHRAARPYCRPGKPIVISADTLQFDEMTGLASMLILAGCPIHLRNFRDQYPSVLFESNRSRSGRTRAEPSAPCLGDSESLLSTTPPIRPLATVAMPRIGESCRTPILSSST